MAFSDDSHFELEEIQNLAQTEARLAHVSSPSESETVSPLSQMDVTEVKNKFRRLASEYITAQHELQLTNYKLAAQEDELLEMKIDAKQNGILTKKYREACLLLSKECTELRSTVDQLQQTLSDSGVHSFSAALNLTSVDGGNNGAASEVEVFQDCMEELPQPTTTPEEKVVVSLSVRFLNRLKDLEIYGEGEDDIENKLSALLNFASSTPCNSPTAKSPSTGHEQLWA